MKIGVLSTCENYAWAGTEEVWFQFAKHALKMGHAVVLGAHANVCDTEQVMQLRTAGLQVASRNPKRPFRIYMAKERVWPQMKQLLNCDIVIINSGSLYDTLNLPWISQFLRRLAAANIRLIFFCHFCADSLPATAYDIERINEFVAQIDKWIFVSEHNRRLAERQLATTFKDSSIVMNGPRLIREAALPWPDEPVTFGCVARLESRWKGQDVLLHCLSDLNWKQREWILNIYGSGPDEVYIRRLVRHYELDNRVKLKGYVRDMESVWRECHAMVLASFGEGTPLAVLEAMMCGRPTITTDVGGNLEILDDGKTGYIASCATPRSFGSTLERAWQDHEHWQTMGLNANKAARQLANEQPEKKLLDLVVACQ